jgi:hypothetical protein
LNLELPENEAGVSMFMNGELEKIVEERQCHKQLNHSGLLCVSLALTFRKLSVLPT